MSKEELIETLMNLDKDLEIEELEESSESELEELLENLTDDELMFPNGRDFDSEGW